MNQKRCRITLGGCGVKIEDAYLQALGVKKMLTLIDTELCRSCQGNLPMQFARDFHKKMEMPKFNALQERLEFIVTALVGDVNDNYSPNVVDALRATKTTGFKGSCYNCPVANFINVAMNVDNYLQVYAGEFHLIVRNFGVRSPLAQMATPIPVYSFITEFDNGNYPELETGIEWPEAVRRSR